MTQIRTNGRNAPTADIFSNYDVWLVCGLILCHFVNLSGLGGIKPTVVGAVVTSSKRCVERSNPICAHQVQEGLGRLLKDGTEKRRKTQMVRTCLSFGKASWSLPSACFTYSNAGSTSAALPSRTRLATLFFPSCKRARTDARQLVHTAKSTSSSSMYVVRASRRAILRQVLKARGKGERTRWMSARAMRPGELVTNASRARRLLYSVDLPDDIGRGIWTVTESGPMLRISSKSRNGAYNHHVPKSSDHSLPPADVHEPYLHIVGPVFAAPRTYLG